MTASLGATNTCATPDSAVKINEFSSNNPDFVELLNTGAGAVDLSGWVLKDNSENNSYTFPAGSSIAAGEYKVLNGESVDFVFGLGNGDSVRLYSDSDLTTPLDSSTYPAHPAAGKSYGRCPNAHRPVRGHRRRDQGRRQPVRASRPAPTNIKINEVQSDPGDLVELTNIGETAVDISGYVLKDNDDTHAFTIPAGTTPRGARRTSPSTSNPSFGLGKGDSVRLYHARTARTCSTPRRTRPTRTPTNWGRCPNGTGAFGVVTDTLGAANACGGGEPSGPPDVVINEVESNGDQVADWVELKNTLRLRRSNVSGWKILDNDPAHVATPVVVPAGTTIPAGGYYADLHRDLADPGLRPRRRRQRHAAPAGRHHPGRHLRPGRAHAATTWGRCPDGTGDFRDDDRLDPRRWPTPAARSGSTRSSPTGGTPGDWVELVNISAGPVDVSGYVVKDSDDARSLRDPGRDHHRRQGLPRPRRERRSASASAAPTRSACTAPTAPRWSSQYTWTTPAAQSYARCKDGARRLQGHARRRPRAPSTPAPAWRPRRGPAARRVTTADLTGTLPPGPLRPGLRPGRPGRAVGRAEQEGHALQADPGRERQLRPGQRLAARTRCTPTAPARPDTEGITIGPDGFVYLASERNNAASGVSRMSILRYDPSATGSTITADQRVEPDQPDPGRRRQPRPRGRRVRPGRAT